MLEIIIASLMAKDESLTKEAATAKAQAMIDEANAPFTTQITDLTAKVTAESGKAAAILEDKKKAQAKAEELASKLEEISDASLSGDEKTKKEVEKLNKALVDATAESEGYKAQIASAAKTHKLDQIAAKFRFIKDLPDGTPRLWIENEFGGIDLESEAAIEATGILFKDKYASMIVTAAPDGSGDKDGKPAPKKDVGDRVKELENMDSKDRQKELRSKR